MRYLGIFLDDKLSWKHHIATLATRARSTVLTLGVLGNSIRGISYANWRRVFHSIILPTLTYGAALWYSGTAQKGLTGPLQVAQNDALRKMCGVFRTTPVVLRVDFTSRKGVPIGLGPRDNGQERNGLPDPGSGPKDR